MRCKHEPEEQSAIDAFFGRAFRCKNCGMEGMYSNGQRKIGRPRRIIWLRRAALAASTETAKDRP